MELGHTGRGAWAYRPRSLNVPASERQVNVVDRALHDRGSPKPAAQVPAAERQVNG